MLNCLKEENWSGSPTSPGLSLPPLCCEMKTDMQFFRCSRVSLLVFGLLLASLSLPFAKFRGEQIDVRLNESLVFSGELEMLSGAYLSLAALLSVGAGSAGFSLAAWRQTSRRLRQSQRQVETLEGLVQQRDRQLQAVQLSPQRLEQVGLHYFLSDDDALQAAALAQNSAQNSVQNLVQNLAQNPAQNIAAVQRLAQQPTPLTPNGARPGGETVLAASPAAALHYLAVPQSPSPRATQSLPVAASAEDRAPGGAPQDTAALQESTAPQRPSFLVINPYQPQVQLPSPRSVSAQRSAATQRSAWPS